MLRAHGLINSQFRGHLIEQFFPGIFLKRYTTPSEADDVCFLLLDALFLETAPPKGAGAHQRAGPSPSSSRPRGVLPTLAKVRLPPGGATGDEAGTAAAWLSSLLGVGYSG